MRRTLETKVCPGGYTIHPETKVNVDLLKRGVGIAVGLVGTKDDPTKTCFMTQAPQGFFSTGGCERCGGPMSCNK